MLATAEAASGTPGQAVHYAEVGAPRARRVIRKTAEFAKLSLSHVREALLAELRSI